MPFASTFDHAVIAVADLDRAVRRYSEALELVVEFEFVLEPFGLRGVVLKSETGWRIELLERARSAPRSRSTGPLDARLTQGFGHVCLDVANVDRAFGHLLLPVPKKGCPAHGRSPVCGWPMWRIRKATSSSSSAGPASHQRLPRAATRRRTYRPVSANQLAASRSSA